MAETTVRVCDECGSQDDVKRYEVREAARKGTTDLCKAHNSSLEELLGAPVKKAQKRTSSRPRARTKVTTMEEIQKLKAK